MYSSYETYPCPYFMNPSNIMYMYPCAYCPNTPVYNPAFFNQFTNEYSPFTNELEYNSRFDLDQSAKNNGLIDLKDYGPKPFVINIEKATIQNNNYRLALWTGCHLQLTLMSINVGDDIGLEVHPNLDQFIRIEQGEGLVKMGNSKYNLDFQEKVSDGFAFIIPAGKWHNLINTGNKPLKLYSIYAPPQHPYGTIHKTKPVANE